MTPKEKAEQLINKYNALHLIFTNKTYQWDKQCALIAVDEILKSHHNLYGINNKQVKFYSEVKQEIEKL